MKRPEGTRRFAVRTLWAGTSFSGRVSEMIARIWHGVTPAAKAEAYYEYLEASGVAEYRRTGGNRGVYVLRKVSGDRADFVLISLWDSFESIRTFAGDDLERARYFPKDREFLLEVEPKVAHYDVLAAPSIS